jgi:hypothetical protein
MTSSQTNTRSIGQFIGHFARSFFGALGEAAKRLDELPLEDKQEIKEQLIGYCQPLAGICASMNLA